MKALIFENRVVQIETEEFPVSPSLIWMESPEGCECGWTLENGILIAPPEQPEWSYDKKRSNEYPSYGDQFDMLMKDMKDGTTTHQTACEAVKAKYPKP